MTPWNTFNAQMFSTLMETGKYLGKKNPPRRQSVPARVLCAACWIPKEEVGWERCQLFDRVFPAFPEGFAVVHPLQSMEDEDSGVLPGNAKPKPSLTPCSVVSAAEACPGTENPLEQGILMDVRIVWMPLSFPWQQKYLRVCLEQMNPYWLPFGSIFLGMFFLHVGCWDESHTCFLCRLQQLDDENSELRSCVPCLRANIERLEEVRPGAAWFGDEILALG